MSDATNHFDDDDGRYMAVTRDIRVLVSTQYLENQSEPSEGKFAWAYTIEIINEGNITVQLRERKWEITDANGTVEQIHGEGVVGEKPTLNPGDDFEYTSGCPLSTDSGFMVGQYVMYTEGDEAFEVNIPAFALDIPHPRRTIN